VNGGGGIAERRLERLRALLARSGDDALLAFSPAYRRDHVRFLAGFNPIGNWAMALLFPEGPVAAFVEHPWDRERVARESCAREVYGGSEVFPALVAALARRRVRGLGVVGLEMMETRFVEALRRVPNVAYRSVSKLVENIRMVKEADEVAAIREAARVADLGYRALIDACRVGRPEYEIAAEVEAAMRAEGAEDNFMLLSSGGREVMAMHPPGTRRVRAGDFVSAEVTPQVQGYYAQVCRTLLVGPPRATQAKAFAIFLRAQQAALEILRPGVTAAELALEQNRVFQEEGFGEYTSRRYTRGRGHGLGMHLDESPAIVEDNETVVKAGMTIILHPNTYLPVAGYLALGDPVLVTADGYERLNSLEQQLFVVEA
jgi:Xaa-Pro aminopeptidase